jgi:hypothetical protein
MEKGELVDYVKGVEISDEEIGESKYIARKAMIRAGDGRYYPKSYYKN